MNATTTTTITCKLTGGQKVTLTTEDCVEIINALARRRLISVNVESIPAEYDDVLTEDCVAVAGESDAGDDDVVLFVNASDFVAATPRVKKTAKKTAKTPAKKR